jgi:hypothetical protein
MLPAFRMPLLDEADIPKPDMDPEFKKIGLGQQKVSQEFKNKALAITHQWEKYTPDQRLAHIKNLVNETTNSIGVPKVEVVRARLPGSMEGNFDTTQCKLLIDENLLESKTLDKEQENKLLVVIYHETRHIEQVYRASQGLAKGKGVSSTEVDEIEEISKTSVIKNIDFMTQSIQAGEINKLSETESKFADAMSKIFSDPYAQYTIDLVNQLKYTQAKLGEVSERFDKARKDDDIWNLPELAAEGKESQERFNKWFAQYERLLQEADARDVQELIGTLSISGVQALQEGLGSQTAGESSTQQVQDNEITQAQPGAVPGARPEATEMEDLGAPRPVGAPPPRPRSHRSTNPISDCLPCFGRSRRSDSRSSGRPRSRDDRRTR